MMAYFKKITNPDQKLFISTGQAFQFERIDVSTGIYPHDGQGISPGLAEEIRILIREQRGGIEEITAAEYRALVQKKKSGSSKPFWREELSKEMFLRSAKLKPPEAVALAATDDDSPPAPVPREALGPDRPSASPRKPPPE